MADIVDLRPRTPTGDRECPFIRDRCMREKCAMWINPRDPVLRLVEGLPVQVQVEDCALVLAGLGALQQMLDRLPAPPT